MERNKNTIKIIKRKIRNVAVNAALILGAVIMACAFLLLVINATVQETEKLDLQIVETGK